MIRGVKLIGYPGSAELVNMQPPAAGQRGSRRCPASATGGSPAPRARPDPQRAARSGGGRRLALLRTGDRIRIDLNKGAADVLISDAELAARRLALQNGGGFKFPASQTPWQEIQRAMVDQLADGMVLKPAVKYQRVAQTFGVPRDNH